MKVSTIFALAAVLAALGLLGAARAPAATSTTKAQSTTAHSTATARHTSAPAAPGDLVGQVTFSQDCGSGVGTGIAYDGAGHLWVSCWNSNPDLFRASATTGIVDLTYNIAGGLGAIAYDSTRNVLWAGWGGSNTGQMYRIDLDANKNVTGSTPAFTAPGAVVCGLLDGLGYDAADDSLYISDDCSTTIWHYTTAGTLLDSFPWNGNGCANSGLAIGGSLLFEGSDGCSHVWVVDKVTKAPSFDFSTGGFRDEGLTCDTDTFAALGKQVMWSKEAYSPNSASAFEIPANTCGVGGQPANPPTCQLTATIPGPPKQIQITVQATDGLASINVDDSTNAVTPVPPFTPNTTNPVVVTSTKIDQSSGAHVQLTVTDTNGGSTVCDPVLPGAKVHLRSAAAVSHAAWSLIGRLL